MSNVPPGAIEIDDPSLVGPPVEIPGLNGTMSSFEDPEAASNQSQAFLESLAQERPSLGAAPNTTVLLPGGWIDPAGKLHNQAVVRELTGRDEEALAKISITENPVGYLHGLLAAVESVGGFPTNDQMLGELLAGDRDMLVLGVRMATYGSEMPVHLVCPACETEQDIAIELDVDVPVQKLEDPTERAFDVPLRNGSTAKVKLLTSADQDYVIEDRKATNAEQRTKTLERCVLSINGLPVNHHTIHDMGMADRQTLLDFLADHQPGPNYGEVSLPCSGCGRKYPLMLSLADLFRP